jgi:hypothetical protein
MSVVARVLRRFSRHIAWRVRRAKTTTVNHFRRRDRTIIMTPPRGLRFGNWLYLWLSAHDRSSEWHPVLVLERPEMQPWLDAFPALRSLTITADEMKFHDWREWDESSWNQRFDVDFSRSALVSFIEIYLAPNIEPDLTGALVVNVRRGDYYARPELRVRYGFDQIGYLKAALAHFGEPKRILVVSDDPDWCRNTLDRMLRSQAPVVTYEEADPLANFVSVAAASRIIGTNSTFTYWAAYIASVLHANTDIVMPRFHARMAHGRTDAYQLDPRWTALDGFH